MSKGIRVKLARVLAPDYIGSLEREAHVIDEEINKRVASLALAIDPLDFLIRDYNGIFSENFEHPDENLNAQGKIGMYMMAYQLKNNPYFDHLIQWIMDSAGNETIKKAPIMEARVQYGRAQISNMVLFKREIQRLSSLYEDELNKGKPEVFDTTNTIE